MEKTLKMPVGRAISKLKIGIKCIKNKLASLILIGFGVFVALLTYKFEGTADITVLVFMLLFAIPLFFAKQNYIDL